MTLRSAGAAVLLLFAAVVAGKAQGVAPRPSGATSSPSDQLGRLTPYGCLTGFLRVADSGDYTRAAAYLEPNAGRVAPEELARKLKVVLDVGLTGNLDGLSRDPEGDLTDGLNPNRERIGSVPTSSGKIDIILNRTKPRDGPEIWLFSAASMRSIPKAYDDVGTFGIVQLLPEKLREVRIFTIPLWRYIVIFVGLVLTFLFSFLLTRLVTPPLRYCLRRVTGVENNTHLARLRNPVRLLILAIATRFLSSLSPSLLNREFWNNVSDLLVIIGLSWLIISVSDIVSDLCARRLLRLQKPDKIAVLALGRRLFKTLAVLVGVTLLLRRGGVNVTAVVAGLGVGGVALALAAQKTLENVFGGVSLIMREAVRVGDYCRIADQTGTVEDIGMGSTRLRTLDRTVVSVPNAQLSQVNLENYTLRDKFWIHQILRLRSDTSAEQMRGVLTGIEEIMRQEKVIESRTARVRFTGFDRASPQLEIYAYVLGTDYEGFLRIQQEFLLRTIEAVTSAGTALSAPMTQIDFYDVPKRVAGDPQQQTASAPPDGKA